MTAVRKNIDDMVRELAPSVEEVAAMLAGAAGGPKEGKFAAGRAFNKLAAGMRHINAATKDVEKGIWPDNLNDDDAGAFEKAIHKARLAVFHAAVLVAIAVASDAGDDVEATVADPEYDLEPLSQLGHALGSALMGSGTGWKKLMPATTIPNTHEPNMVDLRARLVAGAKLADGNNRRLRDLYDGAEKVGIDRKAARTIVKHFRAGNLCSPPLVALMEFHQHTFKPLLDAGRDIAEIFDY